MEQDVIIERIANLKEYFIEEFKSNKDEHCEMKDLIKLHESRINAIENWKLVFVAKYSVYSAIALFLGSVIATLAIQLISRWI